MRSRFEAYADRDEQWLLATWHPSTRPKELVLDEAVRWRALQVVEVVAGRRDDADGIVEFRASYVADGRHGVLHERSRFVREDGRWVYLDGDVYDES